MSQSYSAGAATRVPVNGLRLNARIDGTGNAPWLAFSNSLGTNLSLWDGQVAALHSRFRTLRYDQRGHGGSDMPPEGTDFTDLARDLLGLLDCFGIEKAIFIGVSMGAVTVLRAAALAPDRCRAVIACDGQWASPPAGREARMQRIAMAERDGMEALAHPTVSRWTLPDFPERFPVNCRRLERMVAATPKEGYIGCSRILQDYDFRRDYPSLPMPVLYLAGAQDGAVPGVMKEMAAATPRGIFTAFEHCGHLPHMEQPEAFLETVLSFAERV